MKISQSKRTSRPNLEVDDGDYVQEKTPCLSHQIVERANRRPNRFIDAEAGVDGDASGVEGSDDENDDLDGFIGADDIEF